MTRVVGMSESDFQRRIIETARLHGWLICHHRPARTERGWRTPIQGDAGLPDLILARAGRVLLVELKSDSGSTTPQQRAWLAALGPHGRLWRPALWDVALAELSTRPDPWIEQDTVAVRTADAAS